RRRRGDRRGRRRDRCGDVEEPRLAGTDPRGVPRVRVAMLVAPRRIELRDEAAPAAPAGGMVVRVRAALSDGTDLKTYRRGHPKMPMPTRFGHEFSGDIVAKGEAVTNFSIGDAIMSVHTAPCNRCFWCKNGQPELCETIMSTMILGAYADHIIIPNR